MCLAIHSDIAEHCCFDIYGAEQIQQNGSSDTTSLFATKHQFTI